MHVERHTVTIVTDASGDGTGYTPNVTGRILGIRYVKTDYDNGVDMTITVEDTGEAIVTGTDVNASKSFYPRVPVQDEAGADALFAAGGTKLRDAVHVAGGRVKIVVAQGGNAKTGKFHVLVGG